MRASLLAVSLVLVAGCGHTVDTLSPSSEDLVWTGPRPTPTHAGRSRHVAGRSEYTGQDWSALARCESSGNPRAVSRTGKYRGAFQMDSSFWRTYGGRRYATRPDLATYAEQLAVAQRGYAARGRSPWPYCGRFL